MADAKIILVLGEVWRKLWCSTIFFHFFATKYLATPHFHSFPEGRFYADDPTMRCVILLSMIILSSSTDLEQVIFFFFVTASHIKRAKAAISQIISSDIQDKLLQGERKVFIFVFPWIFPRLKVHMQVDKFLKQQGKRFYFTRLLCGFHLEHWLPPVASEPGDTRPLAVSWSMSPQAFIKAAWVLRQDLQP